MKHTMTLLALAASLLAATAQGAEAAPAPASPHAGPHGGASGAPPKPLPKKDKLAIHGWVAPAPAAWQPVEPASSMRSAQFILPGSTGQGADNGEMVAYFFASGDGGTQEANIERWSSEVTDASGKPVKPSVATTKNAMTKVTLVTLQGNYTRGANMVAGAQAKAGQTLLVAMVETAVGRITLQAYGPSKTVAAHRDSFVRLANSFVPG